MCLFYRLATYLVLEEKERAIMVQVGLHIATIHNLHIQCSSVRTIFQLALASHIPPTVHCLSIRSCRSFDSRLLQNRFVCLSSVWYKAQRTFIFQQRGKKLLLLASNVTLRFILHIWNRSPFLVQKHKHICADALPLDKAAPGTCLMTSCAWILLCSLTED